jgi:predicted nucleic acid-binding protein
VNPEDVPHGPLLVDTDVVSYWIIQSERARAFEDLTAGREMAISFATAGELLANYHRQRWGERRMAALRRHLRTFVVVPYSIQVVELWAMMHAKLSGHLKNGGTNDLWTVACALSTSPQLPVVTNNLSDFQTIAKAFPDLRLVHPEL